MTVEFSANYFKEIKILLLAEKSFSDITKAEVVEPMPVLYYCNSYIFSCEIEQKDDRPDDVIYLNYFYYCKSEKIDSSKWNGHSVEVHDVSNVPLFEVITRKFQERENDACK